MLRLPSESSRSDPPRVFSSHSRLATSHCSRPLNSFISPSYNDSLVSPLFPLDTKMDGGGRPQSCVTPARTRKFLNLFKNFQANSFLSRVFNFLTGGGGSIQLANSELTPVPSVSSVDLNGLCRETEEQHDSTTKPTFSARFSPLATSRSPLRLYFVSSAPAPNACHRPKTGHMIALCKIDSLVVARYPGSKENAP